MKDKKKLLSFLSILFLLSVSICSISASEFGFVTEIIDAEDESNEIEQFKLVKSTQRVISNQIHTFAANEKGEVAVGFYNKSAIEIFDNNGIYRCTYLFNENDKRAYSVEWDGDMLVIIKWGHDKRLVTVDTRVNSIAIEKIPMTNEFNSYLVHVHNATVKQVGDNTYEMRNAMDGLLSIIPRHYTEVVRVDKEGNEKIIADVTELANHEMTIFVIVMLMFIIILVVFLPAIVIRKVKKKKANSMANK